MLRRFAAFAVAFVCSMPLAASAVVSPALVVVGNPGNPADSASGCYDPVASATCGSVPVVFQIGRYEVTNAQYAEFLNAVADTDPRGLFNTSMESDARGGITRSGSSGSYSYAVKGGRANHPVVFVSFYDALRFANWMHNGQPTGAQGNATTESGAYAITGAAVDANSVARNPAALWFLPSENEWYKAAYYDPENVTYFEYPQQTYLQPIHEPPPGGPTSANYWSGTYALTLSGAFDNNFNYLSAVGAYTTAVGPYGTFDQGGNAMEWTEGKSTTPANRARRGSSWDEGNALMSASVPNDSPPLTEEYDLGFRIATPEPGATLMSVAAVLGLALRRRIA